jgi:hypothetical protein
MRLKIAASLFAATTMLGLGAATAEPATAATIRPAVACTTWHDEVTFGVSCTSGSYYSWAKCKNGEEVYGAVASNGGWSYAYCSTVRSSLLTFGYVRI